MSVITLLFGCFSVSSSLLSACLTCSTLVRIGWGELHDPWLTEWASKAFSAYLPLVPVGIVLFTSFLLYPITYLSSDLALSEPYQIICLGYVQHTNKHWIKISKHNIKAWANGIGVASWPVEVTVPEFIAYNELAKYMHGAWCFSTC